MRSLRYRALRRALSWQIARRSLATMLVVGSVPNAINQGDAYPSDSGRLARAWVN